jgi:DNA polymerase-1
MPTTYVFDIEGNGLGEYYIDRKKVGHAECDRIHLLVLRAYPSGETQVFRHNDEMNNIGEGWEILRQADVIVGHNIIQYDLPVLSRLYGSGDPNADVQGKVFDTLVAARVIWPDAKNHPFGGNSLKAFGKHLKCMKGDYEGGWEAWNQEMEDYCVQDTLVSTAILDYIKPKCQPFKHAVKLEHRVATVCAQMQRNGVRINVAEAEDMIDQFDLIKARCIGALLEAFPDIITERISKKTGKRLKDGCETFNPGSAMQVAHRLKSKYDWDAPLTEKGNPSVTEEVLKKLDYDEAKLILHHDMADKRLQHLADWVKRARGSRTPGIIHPQINTCGAATSRGTHQQPNQTACPKVQADKEGNPLMGWPGRYGWEMRSLWGPTIPGNVMVGGDASGIELRLLGAALHPFDGGKYAREVVEGDVHQRTANATGMTRNGVKTPTYATLYGAGATHLDDLCGGKGKGQKFKDGFEGSIDGFGALKSWCAQCASEKGFVPLLDGRHAPIRSEHAALNTLLQGNGAILMKLAMVICETSLSQQGLRYGWMLWPHDEFQFEAHPDDADKVGATIVSSIEKAGIALGVKCPMTGEYKVGSNWAETH